MIKRQFKNHFKGSVRAHILPVMVWLAAIAGVFYLVQHRSQRFEILGIAQGQVYQIAATCTGRLKSVSVKIYDKVVIGQTLAVVDTVLENETIQAQVNTIKAEIENLTAQLATIAEQYQSENTDRQINYNEENRRFAVDVESTRLNILEYKATLASDRVLLGDLNSELSISKRLFEQKIIEPYELEKAKVQYDTLSKKIEENEKLLNQAENDLKQALQRYAEFKSQKPYYVSVDKALDVIHKQIKVQEQLMAELLERFEPVELKSPINGVVIPIQGNLNDVALRRPGEGVIRRAGEVVREGDQILLIAESEPSEIIAYVDEMQSAYVKEGMTVQVANNADPQQIADLQITYISPVIEQLPERLWSSAGIPQWGRPILIKIHPDLKLYSGALVKIKLL